MYPRRVQQQYRQKGYIPLFAFTSTKFVDQVLAKLALAGTVGELVHQKGFPTRLCPLIALLLFVAALKHRRQHISSHIHQETAVARKVGGLCRHSWYLNRAFGRLC